jgi:hypothetical protein
LSLKKKEKNANWVLAWVLVFFAFWFSTATRACLTSPTPSTSSLPVRRSPSSGARRSISTGERLSSYNKLFVSLLNLILFMLIFAVWGFDFV